MRKLICSILIGAIVIAAAIGAIRAFATEDLAQAKSDYQTFCIKCHGAQGKGDGSAAATLKIKPRDFADCARMSKLSNDTLFKVIKDGGAANGLSPDMAAWGQAMDDGEIHALVTFVRNFCKK